MSESSLSLPPQEWLETLPEPAVIVTAEGALVLANSACERLLGPMPPGVGLSELTEGGSEALASHLRLWARSKLPVVGSLRLRAGGAVHEVTAYGARLKGADGRAVYLLLRLLPKHQATGAFRALSEQVRALTRELSARARADAEVAAQRERYRTTLASIGDGVIATDEEGRITFMNPVAQDLTGWSEEDALGRPCEEVFRIVNEVTREALESPAEKALREGASVALARGTLLIAKDGAERPIDDSAAPIRNSAGTLIGTVLVFRDVSERRRAEQDLRESEERFRMIADSAPVLIWMADTSGMCVYVNRRWLEFSGRRMEDELGRGWRELLHPDDLERCVTALRAVLEAREPFEQEYRLRRHDGQYRWVLGQGMPRYLSDERFAGYVGSCTDITERKQAEEQLRSINAMLEERVASRTAQLRELTMRLAQTEQNERRRIAQILHDDLQQFIVAASMRGEVIRTQTTEPRVADTSTELIDLLNQALETSRTLTAQLSPPVLHDSGLCAGLAWLVRWMEVHHKLAIDLTADTTVDPLVDEIKLPLFLAARELLLNVVKHAGVAKAHLRIASNDAATVLLEVRDAGRGFDVGLLEARPPAGGFGLLSLRERVRHLGGAMTIESAPGKGTRARIILPRSPGAESR